MDQPKVIFESERKFGAELELVSFDHRDFKRNPLNREGGEMPQGTEYVATLLMESLKTSVDIQKWGHTHNNAAWVIKPDSSCGIEVCSPVFKGWCGIEQVLRGVWALRRDPKIETDDRCGLHIHVNTADCSENDLSRIITYWIKCETVFLDSCPNSRKRNKYCQHIGASPFLEHDTSCVPGALIQELGITKYYSLNTFHMVRGARPTIEFRVIEGAGCLDPVLMKNWIRLLVHFVETAKAWPHPPKFDGLNPWSSFLWLDPKDVFKFLGFFDSLSPGMTETRNWFLARLFTNINTERKGIWSDSARQVAKKQINEMMVEWNLSPALLQDILCPKDMEKALFAPETRF